MSIELKPCPFCGGEADFYTTGIYAEVWCSVKGCAEAAGETQEEAFAAWNTRAERTCRIEQVPMGIHEEDGDAWVCSNCRVALDFEEFSYCPNCGAKVVEE